MNNRLDSLKELLKIKTAKLIAFLIVLFLVITIVISIVINYQINLDINNASNSQKDFKNHYVFIMQNTQEPFWQSVKQGAEKAADDLGVAVEVLGPSVTNVEEEENFLRIAIASDVDGIITHVPEQDTFKTLINTAADFDIPLVTAITDAEYSNKDAYIGVDNYQLGIESGKAVVDAIGKKGNIALIVGSNEGYRLDPLQYQQIKGFNEFLKNYNDILIIREQYSTNGIISAAQITRNILTTYNSVDAIVCTTPMEALGAAQVLIEQKKQNVVKIIAHEENLQILKYIKNEVIYGTVTSNPFQIGYNCVKSLDDIKNKRELQNNTDSNIEVITKENIESYIKRKNELENANIDLNS